MGTKEENRKREMSSMNRMNKYVHCTVYTDQHTTSEFFSVEYIVILLKVNIHQEMFGCDFPITENLACYMTEKFCVVSI